MAKENSLKKQIETIQDILRRGDRITCKQCNTTMRDNGQEYCKLCNADLYGHIREYFDVE